MKMMRFSCASFDGKRRGLPKQQLLLFVDGSAMEGRGGHGDGGQEYKLNEPTWVGQSQCILHDDRS